MSLDTKPYRGARDFYPEDERLHRYIFRVWSEVAEKFGYERYDAPILESLEIFKAKSSQEIVSEQTYQFTDRGGRDVVIRPEMTPTVSRMVAARRQELAYPLRLYSIPNLWRYERPQKGRLREHWQLNADLFGIENINAEVEMIQIVDSILHRFGASEQDFEIRVNSRKLMNQKIEASQPKAEVNDVIRLIDRYDKLPKDAFDEQLAGLVEHPEIVKSYLENGETSAEIDDLLARCEKLGINVKFVPTIARGFDYYTDIVFEAFDLDPTNNRSICGGGRYDSLVGLFGVEPLPTIGFGFGDVSLSEFLKGHNLIPDLPPETDLYVALAGEVDAADVTSKLRENLNVAVDFSGRKLDKQIKAAVKKGIKWLLVIGETEVATGDFKLKNLETGTEIDCRVDDISLQIKPNDGD